ncbi:SDR family NAD(P)-dependent oxidoreductase [Intrasporangium sp. YIM S08009]|uniref:SDR family NAD(P)-dependent oxidoreductase n=1 Tax=Intrasporangium zincisolvens TaxID=3080018 RepID=UPI002B051E8F|nr:SDR family NAD(P)-dependent oxidoreductase [Intrasporangium sp. YIM S08009]
MSRPAATVALVTGATGGIGRQVASDLAGRGWTVLVAAHSADVARAVAADLTDAGDVRALETGLDASDDVAVAAVPQAVLAAAGRLDVLVNSSAAFAYWTELASAADLDAARAVMEARHFGPWRLTQVLLPLLCESPRPRVVNVSSGAGPYGHLPFGLTRRRPAAARRDASEAALEALTATLAADMAGSGVLVDAVCPGRTPTWPGGERRGAQQVAEAAAALVLAAVLADEGRSAVFLRDGELLPR